MIFLIIYIITVILAFFALFTAFRYHRSFVQRQKAFWSDFWAAAALAFTGPIGLVCLAIELICNHLDA